MEKKKESHPLESIGNDLETLRDDIVDGGTDGKPYPRLSFGRSIRVANKGGWKRARIMVAMSVARVAGSATRPISRTKDAAQIVAALCSSIVLYLVDLPVFWS